MKDAITVQVTVQASIENVWKHWITPADIQQWNIIGNDWHTPLVENDVRDAGRFLFRMEKKDGSFGFDFEGMYDKVIKNERMEYTVSGGRRSVIEFIPDGVYTIVVETFEPEDETPVEKQKEFCQKILNSFKEYVENKMASLV